MRGHRPSFFLPVHLFVHRAIELAPPLPSPLTFFSPFPVLLFPPPPVSNWLCRAMYFLSPAPPSFLPPLVFACAHILLWMRRFSCSLLYLACGYFPHSTSFVPDFLGLCCFFFFHLSVGLGNGSFLCHFFSLCLHSCRACPAFLFAHEAPDVLSVTPGVRCGLGVFLPVCALFCSLHDRLTAWRPLPCKDSSFPSWPIVGTVNCFFVALDYDASFCPIFVSFTLPLSPIRRSPPCLPNPTLK